MTSNLPKLFEFMALVGQLKALLVKDQELMPWHIIWRPMCIKMSLVHDMAESIVGDLAPSDGVSKEEKRILEENAIKRIAGLLSEELSKEIYTLWLEYEEQTTKEAMFVKDLDKFEMILQAQEYEQIDKRPQALQEFFDSTKGKFQTPQVKEWVEELCAKRQCKDNKQT